MRARKSPHRSNGNLYQSTVDVRTPFFNHLIDAGQAKGPHRSNGNPYESTKANRSRLYVRTHDQTQILKDLKVQKHKKNAFRRIRLNVPGFVDPVIRSARISGRLFVRLKIGYLHFFDQKLQK